MKNIIEAAYKKDSCELTITCCGKKFDTSRIDGAPIQQWAFPFSSKGVKWSGLYEELKEFSGSDSFSLLFDSDATSFEVVKYALSETPAKLIGTNNIVGIVYSENPFTTRITVNGVPLDTSRIQNRSIEEWVDAIQIRELQWSGVFEELTEYIGTDIYTVNFVGKPQFMKLLVDRCPDKASVFYRDPKLTEIIKSKSAAVPNAAVMANAQAAAEKAAAISKTAVGKIKTGIPEPAAAANNDNIPIKNAFIRNNILTICAAVSIVLLLLPFVNYTAASEIAESIAVEIGITGCETIFGIGEIPVGDDSSFFGIFMLAAPILLVIMNYIKPLKKHSGYIAVGAPALGLLGAVATLIHINSIIEPFARNVDEGVEVKMAVGIGFILLLVSYILTAVAGLMLHYGLKLPADKVK